MGRTVREIVEALRAPRPVNALAKHQLAAARQKIVALERELADHEAAAEVADEIARIASRTNRAMWPVEKANNVRPPALLAACLDTCTHLALGDVMGDDAPIKVADQESIRLVVHTEGIGRTALAVFALSYPELAVQIDTESLGRLVTAWAGAAEGGRWPVIADVWHKTFKVRLAHVSIKNEIAKLKK